MALSTNEIAQRLFKKLLGKGDTSTTREYYNESINGPTQILSNNIWVDSNKIPTVFFPLSTTLSASTVANIPADAYVYPDGTTGTTLNNAVIQIKEYSLTPDENSGSPTGDVQGYAFYNTNATDIVPFVFSSPYNYYITYTKTPSGTGIITPSTGGNVFDPESGILKFYENNPGDWSNSTSMTIKAAKYIGNKLSAYDLPSINNKLNITDFNSYSSNTNTLIGTKLNITDFNSYSSNTNTLIGTKLNITNFSSYSSNTNTLIGTKLNITDFSSYSSNTKSQIDNKVIEVGICNGSTIRVNNNNDVTTDYGTVLGGQYNTASGYYSFSETCGYSTVSGGYRNTALDNYSFVGGGKCNTAQGTSISLINGYSTIAGGGNNKTNGSYSFIGGGNNNQTYGSFSTVGGGNNNIASYTTINDEGSTVGGGLNNTASGLTSSILGGYNNTALGSYTGILGGRNNKALCNNTFILGSNITATTQNTSYVENLNIKNGIYDSNSSLGDSGNILSSTGTGVRWGSVDNLISGSTSVTSKLSLTNFYTYTSNTNNLIGAKLNITDFNTYTSSTSTIFTCGLGVNSSVRVNGNNIVSSNFSSILGGLNNNMGNNPNIDGRFSIIAAGSGNTLNGCFSNIAGGNFNTTYGCVNIINGGCNNTICGVGSIINGGSENKLLSECIDWNNPYRFSGTTSYFSTIGGGLRNTIFGADCAVIGGGENNTMGSCDIIKSTHSVIAGGLRNRITGTTHSVIGGGGCNTIMSSGCSYNVIGGGILNTIRDSRRSVIAGGASGLICGHCSVIGGGVLNSVVNDCSSILGGCNNTITCTNSFIGGGCNNNIVVPLSSIVGGENNRLCGAGCNQFIGGGNCNSTSSSNSVVVGGFCNFASGGQTFVGGGFKNVSCQAGSFVGAGYCNTSNGTYSFVGGGFCNTITATNSFIGGGANNIVNTLCSGILGGQNNYTNISNTFIIGSNITATTSNTTFVERLNIKCGVYDNNNSIGVSGQLLTSNGNGVYWNDPIYSGTTSCGTVRLFSSNVIDGCYSSVLGGSFNMNYSCGNSSINNGTMNIVGGSVISYPVSQISGGTSTAGSIDNLSLTSCNPTQSITDNTYTVRPYTISGNGGGAVLDITFNGSCDYYAPSGYTITNRGVGYKVGDIIRIPSYIPGFGYQTNLITYTADSLYSANTNFNQVTISGDINSGNSNFIPGVSGILTSLGIYAYNGGGDTPSNGTYNVTGFTSGIGSGSRLSLTYDGNIYPTSISVLSGGTNYSVGDIIVIDGSSVGLSSSNGFNDLYLTATSVSSITGDNVILYNPSNNNTYTSTVIGSSYSCPNTIISTNSTLGNTTSGGFIINSCRLTASGSDNVVLGGINNVINGTSCSFIGNGQYNKISSAYSTIGNGKCNTISTSSVYGTILGGCSNTLSNCHSFILGTNIKTSADCTTYVNCLNINNIPTSSAGLPSGSVWSNGGILTIV